MAAILLTPIISVESICDIMFHHYMLHCCHEIAGVEAGVSST